MKRNCSALMKPRKQCILFLWTFLLVQQLCAQPSITGYTPASGTVGTTVTITGTNFSSTPSNNIVFFGAVRATVSASNATSLTVVVPAGSTYQPITVTVNGLTAFSSKPFLVTFTGGGQINENSFGAKQDFVTDIRPNALAVADFDGDGKSDIATPNDYSSGGFSSISVLRNTGGSGTIAFAANQDYATGAVTYGIASGDIDGDGKPDLVSTSVADATFSVFRNTSSPGTISFASKVDVSTVNAPYAVAIADIDGDGKPDVITLNTMAQTVSVFRNTGSQGSITFAPKVDFSTMLYPQGLALGDLDGDGKTDIAFTNKMSNSFSLYRNTSAPGNVSFATRIDNNCGSGNEPNGIAFGDLDNDSKLDLAVVINNATGGGAQLFRNMSSVGTVSFSFKTSVWSGASNSTVYHVGFNDVNGDGKVDLALTVQGPSSGFATVFQNNSTPGTFSLGTNNNFSSSFAPYGIMMGDMDGDSKPDLVISEFTLENISVFKNNAGTPAVTSFTPTTAAPGATVTISGSNLSGVTGVSFGGIAAASYTIVNATTITAVVGTGASGDITVTNSVGSGKKSGFVFAGPPVVTSFTPGSGFLGTTVTISGYNFNGANAVSFGGIAASSFNVIDPSTIRATIASGASGNVSVTTSYGTATKAGFVYAPIPIIYSFTPTSAGKATTVTISGTNFTGTTAVSFGGVPATSFTVVSSTTITAVVGNGASGDVAVTNGFGTAIKAGFTFIAAPVITSFSPQVARSGMTVTITGNNFTGATSVKFGAYNASSFSVVSPTTITAIVLSGTSGDISVTTAGGTGTLSGFTFVPRPTITSFTPKVTGTGATVTITGTDLSTTNAVSFGGVAAASFTVVNSTTVTAVVASGATGNVTITTIGGTASLTNFSFIATPVVNSFSPASGAVGSVVTIFGANFSTTPSNNIVYFGGVRANVTSATANRLLVTVPTGANYRPISVTVNTRTSYSTSPFAVTFPSVGTFNSTSFAGRVDFVTSGNPESIASGDLDGDGKPDVVMANTYSNSISFFRNTTTTTNLSFAPKIDSAVGPYPHAIKLADIDGDGKLDVLLLTYNRQVGSSGPENTVSIFRNTSTVGTLSFEPKFQLQTDYDPEDLAITDVDLDGKPDLAVTHSGYSISNHEVISVFTNATFAGNLSFGPVRRIFATPNTLSGLFGENSIITADMDKDEWNDLIVGYSLGDFVGIIRHMTFECTGSCWFGPGYGNISAADFDGDGNVDILANDWVLRNIYNGFSLNFDTRRQIGIGGILSVDNLSGDIKPDFVRINPTANTVSAVKNLSTTGSLSFASNVDFKTGNAPAGIVTSDFNGDGKPDVALTNTNSNTFSVLLNGIGNSGPSLTSFSPTTGAIGTVVTITGTNLTGVTGVSFGGVPASSFTVVSPTTITAVVGNGTSGNVEVTTTAGTLSLAWFYYTPTITSFTPASGGTGVTITITGTNFTGATAVSFGGVAANSFTVLSPTTIAAVVASGSSGSVTVTTPGGTATATGFTYVLPPSISSFTPTTGGAGTTVTITGTNLSGATSVRFGNTPAASFTVQSSTSITATVGTGSTGNIFVTTPGGTASSSIFTFIAAPTITSFAPTNAIAGTAVMITGTNLSGATAVSFGGVPATSFTVNSATSISAIVATGGSGSVTVTTPGGTATLAGFTFIAPPTITSFTPTSAVAGTTVTITGTNLTGATAVSFGGVAATSFSVVNATTITAVVGSGASGNVAVTTPGGSASLGGFVFNFPTALPGISGSSNVLSIYPNPSRNDVVIDHPLSSAVSRIVVMDMYGRLILQLSVPRNEAKSRLGVKALSSGVYKIIWTDEKKTAGGLFFKE